MGATTKTEIISLLSDVNREGISCVSHMVSDTL